MEWKKIIDPGQWIDEYKRGDPTVRQLDAKFVEDELNWIKEIGVPDLQTYLAIERKGRGKQGRLLKSAREQIYGLLEEYQNYLKQNEFIDWTDVPHLVLEGINENKIKPPNFDAILIDEAQDFAPVWVQVVAKLIKPEQGVIILADDPAQSIYRFYSWKEKGVHVVGRTRWLKIPYRNTYEIYEAAYQLIATDANLQKSLEDQGLLVVPDLSHSAMRHGPKPLIQRFNNFDDEIVNIRSSIDLLLQQGIDSRQIAVLHRHRSGVKRLEEGLKGHDVHTNTFHAFKGLEFDTVFLSQLQETLVRNASEAEMSGERRLVYMAMTRARQQLFMGYQGKLPKKYSALKDYVESIV